jgi:hypothetical protein
MGYLQEMKTYLLFSVCIVLAVSCRFWSRDYRHPEPLGVGWCDKFDAEPIPERDTPYLIEGEWVDALTGEHRMTFYPNGTTDNDRVRWRIENIKYHLIVGNEPHAFYVYNRGDRHCAVRAIAVDKSYMIIRDLDVEEVFIKKSAEKPQQPQRPDFDNPDGGVDAGSAKSHSGSDET